jgi:hypothetical protein
VRASAVSGTSRTRILMCGTIAQTFPQLRSSAPSGSADALD